MDRDYDLFERLDDGSVIWRACVRGIENAIAKLKEMGGDSPNEHFAIHTPTKAVVARVNATSSDEPDV
ncbi:MAG: hypothetical protein WCC03_13680 [Candidatus Acidiferrales bacterium]